MEYLSSKQVKSGRYRWNCLFMKHIFSRKMKSLLRFYTIIYGVWVFRRQKYYGKLIEFLPKIFCFKYSYFGNVWAIYMNFITNWSRQTESNYRLWKSSHIFWNQYRCNLIRKIYKMPGVKIQWFHKFFKCTFILEMKSLGVRAAGDQWNPNSLSLFFPSNWFGGSVRETICWRILERFLVKTKISLKLFCHFPSH